MRRAMGQSDTVKTFSGTDESAQESFAFLVEAEVER
jgi:hypothetical protein